MGRIVVTEFVSLDGVVEAPGGGEGFARRVVASRSSAATKGNQFKLDETMGIRGVAARTRDVRGFCRGLAVAGRASSQTSSTRCRSTSSPRRSRARSGPTRRCSRDVAEEVAALKSTLEGDVVVHGSARLVQTLIDRDLVDELRLMVFPVVLGNGEEALRRDERQEAAAARQCSTIVGDGVAILVYEPAAN